MNRSFNNTGPVLVPLTYIEKNSDIKESKAVDKDDAKSPGTLRSRSLTKEGIGTDETSQAL